MPPQTIRITYDSNLRYLPLVYLLSEELMSRCPTLMKIPPQSLSGTTIQ